MSKSKGNYIGITDAPNDMFGKVMSIPDALMANYYTLLTNVPAEEIATRCDSEKTHPRQAKGELGKLIVAKYHDADAADAAAEEFDRVFAQKSAPADMPTAHSDENTTFTDIMTESGLVESRSQARRLAKQNAVSLDGEKIVDSDMTVFSQLKENEGKLKFGKRKHVRIVRGKLDEEEESGDGDLEGWEAKE